MIPQFQIKKNVNDKPVMKILSNHNIPFGIGEVVFYKELPYRIIGYKDDLLVTQSEDEEKEELIVEKEQVVPSKKKVVYNLENWFWGEDLHVNKSTFIKLIKPVSQEVEDCIVNKEYDKLRDLLLEEGKDKLLNLIYNERN